MEGVSATKKVEWGGSWVLMADVADVKWRRIVHGAYRDYISRYLSCPWRQLHHGLPAPMAEYL